MNSDYQTALDALRYVDPHDRDTWIRMGMAVKAGLGEEGFTPWDEWSQQAESYNPRDARSAWNSFKGGSINFGSLIHEAKQRGFQPARQSSPPSAAEIERRKREQAERNAKTDAELRQKRDATALQAQEIWKVCKAVESHPYTTRKGINPQGARLYHGGLVISGVRCNGALVLPIYNPEGVIRSLQFITESGDKLFLWGDMSGNYYASGDPANGIVIAEGYATGQSIREATGRAVAIAFNAGNIGKVAATMRAKYPNESITIAGDNDTENVCTKHRAEGKTEAVSPLSQRPDWCKCNPGLSAAVKASNATGAMLAYPVVEGGKDFNDLHQSLGLEEVRKQLENATIKTDAQPEAQQQKEKHATREAGAASGPEPLPSLPDVMPFNYEALPQVLRSYVQDIADRMQCPPDFVAVSCLVMVSSVIGRKVGMRPKRYDNWTAVPNLWGMVVGKSGIMKSPAMSAALKPLRELQARAHDEHKSILQNYEAEARVSKFALEDAEARARKAMKDGYSDRATALLLDAGKQIPPAPTVTRYIVNDSTVEALTETLEENQNGVMVDRDELSGWLRSLDKEGQQEARAFYLSAADGDKGFTVDRIGRGRNKHIQTVTVSIIGGIQPGVLASYVRDTKQGGKGDDGLLQRFGLIVYPDIAKEWRNVDRKPDQQARQAVDALIADLASMTPESVGATVDEYQPIPFLRFDHAAQALFEEWLSDLEGKIRSDDEHPAIISHLSKYRKLLPALALINHLCAGGKGPVTERPLSQALLMVDYLESHARRVYSYALRPDVDAARSLLSKIKARKLQAPFSARHVYRANWSGLGTPEEAGSAIRLLCDLGWLLEVTQERDANGGRPSPIYAAHPSITGAA